MIKGEIKVGKNYIGTQADWEEGVRVLIKFYLHKQSVSEKRRGQNERTNCPRRLPKGALLPSLSICLVDISSIIIWY